MSCSSSKSENSNSDRSHSLTPPAKRGVGMRPLATNLSKWVAERPTNKLACTLRSPDGVMNILSLGIIPHTVWTGSWSWQNRATGAPRGSVRCTRPCHDRRDNSSHCPSRVIAPTLTFSFVFLCISHLYFLYTSHKAKLVVDFKFSG